MSTNLPPAVLFRWDQHGFVHLLRLCAQFPTGKREVGAIPYPSAEVYGSWEGRGKYLLSRQGLCDFKCFLCGQIWKVFTRKAKSISLAVGVTHLAKFQVPLPHVVRNLAFLWAPSSHYPRRRSWMSLGIFACVWHFFYHRKITF